MTRGRMEHLLHAAESVATCAELLSYMRSAEARTHAELMVRLRLEVLLELVRMEEINRRVES